MDVLGEKFIYLNFRNCRFYRITFKRFIVFCVFSLVNCNLLLCCCRIMKKTWFCFSIVSGGFAVMRGQRRSSACYRTFSFRHGSSHSALFIARYGRSFWYYFLSICNFNGNRCNNKTAFLLF